MTTKRRKYKQAWHFVREDKTLRDGRLLEIDDAYELITDAQTAINEHDSL